MKISKVNHTRAAVGVKQENILGVLYKTPSGDTRELKRYIKELNRNAKSLYNLFNTKKGTRSGSAKNNSKLADVIKDTANKKVFSRLIEEIKQADYYNQAKLVECVKNIRLDDTKRNEITSKCKSDLSLIEKECDRLIGFDLRKSMKKTITLENGEKLCTEDVIKSILINAITGENSQPAYSDEELALFTKCLYEDINKEKQIKQIANSIENQGVKVKATDNNGSCLLTLSSADNKKKKYIFEFMADYAASTKENRDELMKHMRRLILLYICGIEAYNIALDNGLGSWTYGSSEPEEGENFSPEAYDDIMEYYQLKREDKNKKYELEKKIKNELRDTIARKYRTAISVDGLTESDKYWIAYIEEETENLLTGKKISEGKIELRLSNKYLCKRIWSDWVAFIGSKYVDMGKGVYHFVLPDLSEVTKGQTLDICEVQPQFRKGITSFDYEMIKADESINRELSVYATFSANNFARSVCDYEKIENENNEKSQAEDVLLYNENDFKKYCYTDNTVKIILQYFGGYSKWQDEVVSLADNFELFEQIKNHIYNARNVSFHYIAQMENKNGDNELVKNLFECEVDRLGAHIRRKYYSNNVLCFYGINDINTLMDFLYNKPKYRPAQMPAFNRICNKAKMKQILDKVIKGNSLKKVVGKDQNITQMYYSTMMFLLKEIYYYGFAADEESAERIMDIAKRHSEDTSAAKNERAAAENFKKRLDELEGCTFGEICQQLMTDYEMQNNRSHKVSNTHDNDKYKHFRTLLYNYIYEAFCEYITKSEKVKAILNPIREPSYRENALENISVDEFCSEWQAHHYDDLKNGMSDDMFIAAWYVTAHFLSPKQVNHMIGSLKSYVQFVEDVEKRAEKTGNTVAKKGNLSDYVNLQRVLELVMVSCGQTSNVFGDYFSDEEEYASFLAKFVNFKDAKMENHIALKQFCAQKLKPNKPETIGIYHNGTEPILNKNIIQAKLYGGIKAFTGVIKPLEEREIRDYYTRKAQLEEVFKRGRCISEEEQKKLRRFQDEKNKVELLDIVDYSNIVTDLYAQLISWSYFKERDLMYFKLGFHYIQLYYGNGQYGEYLNTINGNGVEIKRGAVLYQIAAAYTRSLPLLNTDGSLLTKPNSGTIPSKINKFAKKYCKDNGEIWESGLEFFQDMKEENKINSLRNCIDHFKYFVRQDKSLLDLYGDVYQYFFTYDRKLQKSVTYVLTNILAKHFVKAEIDMSQKREDSGKNIAKIGFSGALDCEYLTYKISDATSKVQEKVELPALSDDFLGQLKNILEYSR